MQQYLLYSIMQVYVWIDACHHALIPSINSGRQIKSETIDFHGDFIYVYFACMISVCKAITGLLTVRDSFSTHPYVLPLPRPKAKRELPPGLKQRYFPFGSGL
jgi:hypothetical protein